MSRNNRNRPLPELQVVRVDDSKVQRALDAITTPLRALIQFVQPFVQPGAWSALPPSSGDWGRGSTANKLAQYRNVPGYVELRGETKTVAGLLTTMGVLPLGSRPHVVLSFPVTVYSGGIAPGRVDINPDGRVLLTDPAVAANIEVYLDGIRFSPEE